MLDSIYHITLKLIKKNNCKRQDFVICYATAYNGRHYVA